MTVSPPTRGDNLLDYADQGLFLALRATGQESVAQMVWIYEHPIDLDRLRHFHANLAHGLLGRRIERSPLPFGRHRWVSAAGVTGRLDLVETPRPRRELSDWADERTRISADPEVGPGWHLGVARFDDGSTAVSLVASHCLVDGMGLIQTVVNAITDQPRDLELPAPASRPTLRGAFMDLRESLRGLGPAARAFALMAKLAVRDRPRGGRRARDSGTSAHVAVEEVQAPSVVAFVDRESWDAKAEELSGSSHSLVAGFAAKLAERMGRIRVEDGTVKLIIPVNEREADDTRANAVVLGYANLDPIPVTSSLADARVVIREALQAVRQEPNESFQTLPLIPFIPKRAVVGGADVMFGFAAELPVSASNLGDIDPTVTRADGTEADYFYIRGVDGRVTRDVLERRRGFLTVICARVAGRVVLPIIAYRPGVDNSKNALRDDVALTLSEFGLAAVIE